MSLEKIATKNYVNSNDFKTVLRSFKGIVPEELNCLPFLPFYLEKLLSLYLYRIDATTPIEELRTLKNESKFAWSPCGECIATSFFSNQIFDVFSGTVNNKMSLASELFSRIFSDDLPRRKIAKAVFSEKIVWSPCGTYVATVTMFSQIYIKNLKTGVLKILNTNKQDYKILNLTFSPSGDAIAFTLKDRHGNFTPERNNVMLWNFQIESHFRTLEGYTNPIESIESINWSPCGQFIMTTSGYTTRIWDTITFECKETIRFPVTSFSSQLSPCGKFIAIRTILSGNITGFNDAVVIFDICDPQNPLQIISFDDDEARKITWNPESNLLAIKSYFPRPRSLIIVNPFSGEIVQTIKANYPFFSHIAWSPCGRFLAFYDKDTENKDVIRIFGIRRHQLTLDQQLAVLKAFIFKELDPDLNHIYETLPEPVRAKLRTII